MSTVPTPRLSVQHSLPGDQLAAQAQRLVQEVYALRSGHPPYAGLAPQERAEQLVQLELTAQEKAEIIERDETEDCLSALEAECDAERWDGLE